MDIKEKKYNLLRERVPIEAFGQYQMLPDYQRVRETLNERKYHVGDTRISNRVIAHWDKNKLIPEGVRDGSDSWRKFSLVEMVWLRAMLHLRDFGISLERIKNVKDSILHWNKKTKYYPSFEFHIAQTIGGADNYILVEANGSARLVFIEEIEMGKIFGQYSHVLLLSFRSILKELNQDITDNNSLFGLSSNEIMLLSEIRKKGNKEVRARIKDQKISELETTQIFPENPSLEEISKSLKQENAYAEVLTKYEGGVKQSSEVKKRKRL